jgi:hypothetical protein
MLSRNPKKGKGLCGFVSREKKGIEKGTATNGGQRVSWDVLVRCKIPAWMFLVPLALSSGVPPTAMLQLGA